MSVGKLLSNWRAEPTIGTNIVDWREVPARPARTIPLPGGLHPSLIAALHSLEIHSLFTHQAAAWDYARSKKNVAVVTGTASGKTLCYNLPVIDRLLSEEESCALFLFPTKALAQDQAAALQSLINATVQSRPFGTDAERRSKYPGYIPTSSPDDIQNPIAFGIYDGDTAAQTRLKLRSQVRLLISNPDMLHIGILPHHTRWSRFFQKLRIVVIDEMHIYRGVFGSHVANVIRRLKRVANFYGSQPTFILTSATIANPRELAEGLVEEPCELVDEDGAGRGRKHFLIYNPPMVDRKLGIRLSAIQESVRLAEDLLTYNVQSIIFGRSRRTVEIILTYLRERSYPADGSSPPSEDESRVDGFIRGYRSGYLPEKRRAIENGLRHGRVRAVVATNALELGIDIGGMGGALLVGYPGSIAATWQQAGRAGRSEAASLAVLVATADPLDQFLAAHPEYFFGRSPENALINPDNPLILLDHMRCAAFELPFQEGASFGKVDPAQVSELLDTLVQQQVLHRSGEKYFWMADQYPAGSISLRSASAEPVVLQAGENENRAMIGQIDQGSAYWMVHPDAIYLHEGQSFLVEDLDLDTKIARLRRAETDYYTISRSETMVQLIELLQSAHANGAQKSLGDILVTLQVTGYRKVRWHTHEQLGVGELDLPPTELLTTGYWLTLDETTIQYLREHGLWRGDPNDYGPNWKTQRELARARDDYRCQVCGAEEGERSHDVHHITPFRSFLSYEQANQLDNLATLCQSCHHRAETAVRVRSGLAGLSYTLSQLAPLFLMCDVGDLGVHSDPQSPLGEGAPTVVLYDRVPAGIGFSLHLYNQHDELIARARELVASCKCDDGCPSCVGPGGEIGQGGKQETLAILEMLRGRQQAASTRSK